MMTEDNSLCMSCRYQTGNWVFKEIMNQRLSEESKCDYKKAIIEFCRFMNIDTPLVEVMVDEFLQEVF